MDVESKARNPTPQDARLDADSDSGDGNRTNSRHSNTKQRILIMLLACAAMDGIMTVFLPEVVEDFYFVPILQLVLSVVWCHVDANERDHVMGKCMKISLVLLFLFAFPIYVFQTRGLSGFKTLAFTALFVAAMFACVVAGILCAMLAGSGATVLLG